MKTAKPQLTKTIMRRVYYAFACRMVTHPMTVYALILLAFVWWLKELVFLARIWESFVATPVGDLGRFAVSLFGNADTLTVIVFVATTLITLRLFGRIMKLITPSTRVYG